MRMKPYTLSLLATGAALSLLTLAGAAFAQTASGINFPASDSAGAILNREQSLFNLEHYAPYEFRPITPDDVHPPAQPPVITYEKGVLPQSSRVQGFITTPSGSAEVSPGGSGSP